MWTNESLSVLRLLLTENISYQDIAKTLNEKFGTNFTKNAISGKVYRGNLNNNERKPRVQKPKTLPKAIKREQLTMTLEELKSGGCRYTADVKHFCGEPTLEKKPYCAYHASMCYKVKNED